MSILFEKLLALLIYPLGFGILLIIAGMALGIVGRRRASTIVLVCAVAGLWAFSTPLASRLLLASLEGPLLPGQGTTPFNGDVAILLGGFIRGQAQQREGPDLTDAADRAVEAFRLFRSGRVKYILVTGGNPPWSSESIPEAEHVARLLREWGTPAGAILIETKSRNTRENAVNSKHLWDERGFKSGLLVTSASHMPRALATFRAAGFSVAPAATDFRGQPYFEGGILALLPDAQALDNSTMAIKEWVGHVVYRFRGWS